MDINEFNALKIGDILYDDRPNYKNKFIILNIGKFITLKIIELNNVPSTNNMTINFGKDMILKFKKINNYIEEDE